MLEISKKWLSAAEARKSIETGDFFRMLNGNSLVITSEAEASAAGKVRFNYFVKETGETGTAYLEGLTRKVKQIVNVGDKTNTTVPAKIENSQTKGTTVVKQVIPGTTKGLIKAQGLINEAISLLSCSKIKAEAIQAAFDIAYIETLNNQRQMSEFITSPERKQAQAEAARRKKRAEEERIKKQAEEEAAYKQLLKTANDMNIAPEELLKMLAQLNK